MARAKKKWVNFVTGITIPKDVIGEKKDKKVKRGEEVQLPGSYADHLIADRFAVECDPPKKTSKKASQSSQQVDDADAAKKLAEAQDVVDGITAKMEAMSEGDDGWAELSEQLDEARTALAELQTPA